MNTEILIILIVLVAGFAGLAWMLNKKKSGADDALNSANKDLVEKLSAMSEKVVGLAQGQGLLQSQWLEISKQLQEKIDNSSQHSQRILQSQFVETARLSKEMTEKILKLEETNKQVINFTDQLQSLEKVLTSSKNRGTLGEANLELILSNILPPQGYEMQYHFADGAAVDAVIKIKDKILPIDAKFSLDNYRRIMDETNTDKKAELEKEFKNDLKKRIEETAKYIRPREKTFEFAFMFIPAEGIYYDLLVNEIGAIKVNTRSLIDYAFNEKKVIIVSPTTFAAYLQTVLQGLRALQIEESAQEILANVGKLQKHMGAYFDFHQKLGNQLGTAVNTYNTSTKELNKLDKDVTKITKVEAVALEAPVLDKPRVELDD